MMRAERVRRESAKVKRRHQLIFMRLLKKIMQMRVEEEGGGRGEREGRGRKRFFDE